MATGPGGVVTVLHSSPQRAKMEAMAALGRAEVRELRKDDAVSPTPDSLADLAAHHNTRIEEQVELTPLIGDEADGGFNSPVEPPR